MWIFFYHHCMDPETPLEESMGALAHAVKSGKALYVGISNYSPEKTEEAEKLLKEMGVHCLIHQQRYNMLNRAVEKEGLFTTLEQCGIGATAFSPLAQGLLSGKYNNSIPEDSRVAGASKFLSENNLTQETLDKVVFLGKIAQRRGQSTAQLALAWILHQPVMTSVLIGASRVSQLEDNVGALKNLDFSDVELAEIEQILK